MSDIIRIYVASLADYNAGRLHGEWVDIDGQDVDAIQEAVDEMLAKSKEPVAEEWAIHDYEGFGFYKVSEWESFANIALLGQVAEELDDDFDAFTAWLSNDGADLSDYEDDPSGLAEKFREQYRGNWGSFKDFVLESDYGDMFLGIHELRTAIEGAGYDFDRSKQGYRDMYDRLTNYIDWDMVARDLEGDYTTENAGLGNGIYVFDMNA